MLAISNVGLFCWKQKCDFKDGFNFVGFPFNGSCMKTGIHLAILALIGTTLSKEEC